MRHMRPPRIVPHQGTPTFVTPPLSPAHARRGALVDPLREVVRALERRLDLVGRHGGVLREVLRVLPREELHPVLLVRLAAEVAVRRRRVVLRLAEHEVAREGAGARVELHLDDVGDRLRGELALLGAVRLDEEREGVWRRRSRTRAGRARACTAPPSPPTSPSTGTRTPPSGRPSSGPCPRRRRRRARPSRRTCR